MWVSHKWSWIDINSRTSPSWTNRSYPSSNSAALGQNSPGKKEVDSEFRNSRKAATILKFWKLIWQKRSWLWILKFLHSGNCGIFEVLTVSDSITPILKVITCNILTFGFKGHYIYLVVETYDKWWWWIKMDKYWLRWMKMDKDG